MVRIFQYLIKIILFFTWIYKIEADMSSSTPSTKWNATYTDKLKHELLFRYDKFARPAQHYNSTRVKMGLIIKHIEIDEPKSMMIVSAWNRLAWYDEKLKWNISEYGNLTSLHVADHEIWQPDVVLYNSALANNIDHYGNTHCLVSYDGFVLWVPPAQLPIFCNLDLKWWPYDTQSCNLSFGSWSYSGEQINLTVNYIEGIDDPEDYNKEGEWELNSVNWKRLEIVYPCCVEKYIRIDYTITVQRRSPTYHIIVLIPGITTMMLTLVVFWIIPGSTEKFMVSGITSIIITMYLIYFSNRLPSVSSSTPIVLVFFSLNLCLVCLSLVVSVIAHLICKNYGIKPVPRFIKTMLTGKLGCVLLLPEALLKSNTTVSTTNIIQKNDEEEMQECNVSSRQESSNEVSTTNKYDSNWILVAIVVDRFMFLFCSIIFFVIGISFYFS